ncbi:MAG: MnmC family methyltransferase [Leptolyngbyaceae bacterium]|nr:MnmC family methyltransferase [Leptolyngbyaceae bacterium]
MQRVDLWIPFQTHDGSYTFFSERFKEHFHSRDGAKTEAVQKFSEVAKLTQKSRHASVRLLDVCYGLGYNSAAALETIWRENPACSVTLYGLELDASVPLAAIAPPLIDSWSPPVQQVLRAIAQQQQCQTEQLNAHLLIGDARETIQKLVQQGFQSDAIFFDPFSPRRCPQLWTVEFFTQVVRCLAPTGILTTYSRSASVRAAMIEAGLKIGTIPLDEPGRSHEWAMGTVGAFSTDDLHPLSPMEHEHLQTRAATPFRDLTLTDTAEQILERHQLEQQASPKEATTQWRRRWGIR